MKPGLCRVVEQRNRRTFAIISQRAIDQSLVACYQNKDQKGSSKHNKLKKERSKKREKL
jgi:hypothetical protein